MIKLAGNSVVELARERFSMGVECSSNLPEEDKDWSGSIARTQELIKMGQTVMFNPAFLVDRLMCDVHILERKAGQWTAYIVKTATRVSEKSLWRAAFRYHVIKLSGIELTDLKLLVIDKNYELEGDPAPLSFFSERSIIHEVESLEAEVTRQIQEMKRALNKNQPPEVPIGPHCTEPRFCDYKDHCWKRVPQNSIFELVGFQKESMFNFWNSGIKTIDQIPKTTKLSFDQEIQRSAQVRINRKALKDFFDRVKYPLLLIDFECFLPAIPIEEGDRPFSLIPFLFAGYKISHPNANPELVLHISSANGDCRREFIKQFIPLANEAQSILCYDTNTEKNVVKGLRHFFPEHRDSLNEILEKFIDLSNPLRRKDLYLPEMKGFYSLKYVLPAISKEYSYQDLDVQSGRMAANLFQVVYFSKDEEFRQKHIQQLLNYSKRDALGLLKVFTTIKRLADGENL